MAETERPLDPDDLPIAAEQTEDERSYAASILQASGIYRPIDGAGHAGGNGDGRSPHGVDGTDLTGRRLSLRALTNRLGPRAK